MNEEEVFYDADDEYCDPGTGASYSLHRAAFENDVAKLTALLQETAPEQRSLLDLHGNNPLHIAALRGNTGAVQALLDAGLSPSNRSSRGWTPLDEACACRSMAAARLLQRALLAEVKGEMKAKRAQLLDTMRSMPDYSLQLKWQIGSSLPGLGMLLRRYAPHDTYTIWKTSWVDLSADKKALKLEGRAEEQELEAELAAAMERDVDKLRMKPRQFKFTPVRGWLGGALTEKVEGWKCAVYEAAGKLLAVSTSKARLRLPKGASFDDYLAAEYEADEVTETLIDPLNPASMGPGGSSNGSKHRSRDKSSHAGYDEKGSLTYGGSSSAADDSMGLGSDADFEALMWNEPSSSSSSSKKDKKAASKKGSSSSGEVDGAAAGGGRLLRARCWMAQDFPMQLAQLLPLLDVIGTANKHMAKVGKFLAKYSQMDMFPVKLQVPLLLTVYVLVSFKAFHPLLPGSATPPPAPEFFDVPESYKRRLLSEVMDKAAANMMGMGPGRGSSRGGSSGGGSCFYGGDEGEEDMLGIFGGDDEDEEDFLAGRDEELQREFERLRDEREGVSAGGSSSSKGKRKQKAQKGLFGSGLDADMQESSKW
ncbi:hypothetical protein OEZ85_007741 [Tetradesmus obliquus]|uniref:Ankyrin repeat domain-containing protein n=1 Tax=Tetradesmus obliquus TaxID=3088 RepID=A0ABY8TLB7_TETOB|nr:hypothetical protein OEZ85_007741 [Tetradesmus obliquus]